MRSKQRILFGCYAMVLAIIGDYLLGYGTLGTSSDPEAYMGISWNVAPDWRYAVSSILGFLSAAMFAYAATELMKVMDERLELKDSGLYKIFKIANWGGILYFAFIHIGICILPVVFNAGMEATGDIPAAVAMTIRVLKSEAIPLILGFLVCDLLVTIGWIGMVLKGMLPVKKIFFLCCPVFGMLFGQLLNLISEGLDSGTESLGWLALYLVCALSLTGEKETKQ
ncbi:MAG: hypothetical protein K6G12_09870 [Lachnospiraceae bacterium]|nr:hypothetical protein [Lachnospiraceae bacterium]